MGLKTVKDALVNAARRAPTERIPDELNSILANLHKLRSLINAYARARIFTRSPEAELADTFKGEYNKYVAEHVRCCKLQPPVMSKKELTQKQRVKKAIEATNAYVRARGTGQFVYNTGDCVRKRIIMNDTRRVAGLPKYVPPH